MAEAKEQGVVPRTASTSGYQPGDWFWDSRKKANDSNSTLWFNALRLLDLPLQWYMLRSGVGSSLIRRLGGNPIMPSASPPTALGLSPYHTLIFGLAVGSSAKQIYWKTLVNDTNMPMGFSTAICVYNTVLNSFNTLLAIWAVTSQQPVDESSLSATLASAPLALKVGLPMYAVGLFVEWWCEIQRQSFKRDPRNKGKPYAGGLFGVVRNVNYSGYTLWRAGYSAICGGWVWAGVQAAWLLGDFGARAVPSMDAYCEKRYGEQWAEVKRKVPHALVPGIY
ncbi:hypothetical protein MBLNU230_g3274t1 [Neophaeotheca triangularis]